MLGFGSGKQPHGGGNPERDRAVFGIDLGLDGRAASRAGRLCVFGRNHASVAVELPECDFGNTGRRLCARSLGSRRMQPRHQ
jgi:hypothetical protein